MRNILRAGILVCACAFALIALVGCEPPQPTQISNKVHESEKAAAVAESIRFTENAEIENIKKRLELTSQPGLIGYIAIINKVGQVVLYTPVKGKVTSGKKRLTRDFAFIRCKTGEYTSDCQIKAPSDEGTYGESSDYMYFWTPGEQYFQTDLGYIYSDKPMRLTIEPLLSLSGVTVTPKG